MLRAMGAVAALTVAGCGVWVDQRADMRAETARAAHPPSGQFVEVAGTRVHAHVSGSGPDLVLIHGASGNLRDFTFSLAERLDDSYRVIAFDRPGLGYTGRADPAYSGAFSARAESPQEQAAMLARAARTLGAERPIVLGHSYGGSVAMAWGLDQPAAAVVSVSGAIMPWPGSLDTQYRVLGTSLGGALGAPLASALARQDTIRSAVRGIFAPQPVPEGYLDHVGAALSLRPATIRANARQVNSLRPHLVTMSARYPDLDLPVELVHGEADRIVPLEIHAAQAAPLLPDARLTTLPGIGHMPHHVAEDAVVAAIDRAAARAGLR